MRLLTALVLCVLFACRPARAYSVLTHEELIDLTWKSSIVPLLLSRYPELTAAELEHARAYAYGGCVIQDIGYYPLGDPFFSNLTHYVRTGDFVVNLLRDARNADELAFAIGALSHYIGDSTGHSEATNLAVPVEFPKLRREYGDVVTYADGEHQHVQTEFAFDIDDIAQGRLAPVHYLRSVGLDVPVQQLALAFYQTYGLSEDFTVGRKRRINVRAYRFAVHGMIPRVAYAVTLLHRRREPVDTNNADLQQLQKAVAEVKQENNWAAYRRRPGIGTYSLAALIYVIPKIGPLKLVAVKGPTAQTEADYVHSLVKSTDQLSKALRRFTPSRVQQTATTAEAVEPPPTSDAHADASLNTLSAPDSRMRSGHSPAPVDPKHPLPNWDLDTGGPVRPSGYRLTDTTYALLVQRLTANPQQPIPPGVKANILTYYQDRGLPFATKQDPAAWTKLQQELATLETMPTSLEQAPYATYGDQ